MKLTESIMAKINESESVIDWQAVVNEIMSKGEYRWSFEDGPCTDGGFYKSFDLEAFENDHEGAYEALCDAYDDEYAISLTNKPVLWVWWNDDTMDLALISEADAEAKEIFINHLKDIYNTDREYFDNVYSEKGAKGFVEEISYENMWS